MIVALAAALADHGVRSGGAPDHDVTLAEVDIDDVGGSQRALRAFAEAGGAPLRVALLSPSDDPVATTTAREAIRQLAREIAPSRRIVGVVGRLEAEADILRVIAYLAAAPSVTGQVIDPG